MGTPPKWPSQISFLSPNTLIDLCTKQSPPPAYSKIPWWLLSNFSQEGLATAPKWPSQISFLSPNILVNLCTKQSLPPAYSRLLGVHALSSPSQGGDQSPSSTLLDGFLLTWALSFPAAVHYMLMWKVWELRSTILEEGWGAFPRLEDSSHKASE